VRVISGSCRGRKLIPIKGKDVRPTSDRVKESIFNIIGPDIRDSIVLDLFSGTGALGIEALSRGAARAIFADKSCTILRQNIELCRFCEQADTLEIDLCKQNFLPRLNRQTFDYIFLDPPYGKGFIEQIINNRRIGDTLAPAGTIIAEQSAGENLEIKDPHLDIVRQKKYSNTVIRFIKHKH
jgi:16S rRNA (guanine966-N2)-methyltransferase